MAAVPAGRIPTLDDLRIKLCFICREEENSDAPEEGPPRRWTHPCKCTLVAHEQCLLKWIQTGQARPYPMENALKCPQCGTAYELESHNPFILKAFGAVRKVFNRGGSAFAYFLSASALVVIGSGIYICFAGYGAWAVERFVGKEMFDLILTDDPTNWPWSAFINLPLLPISLVLSRLPRTQSILIPLLIAWAPSLPVGPEGEKFFEFWSHPENSDRLSEIFYPSTLYWPPPPALLGLVFIPFLQMYYRKLYAGLYHKVMGEPLPLPGRIPRGGLRFNEGPLIVRIHAHAEDEHDEDQHPPQQNHGAAAEDAGVVPALEDGQPVAGQAGNDNHNADPNVADGEGDLIEINMASIGRLIGGALIIPEISSFMGSILYRLSHHSRILRTFLGIRKHIHLASRSQPSHPFPRPPLGLLSLLPSWNGFQVKTIFYKLALSIWGTGMWMDSDPVWWRNAVGLGLFVVMKDSLDLLYLWLRKRELESRHVKDRDFKDVDIRGLELKPNFHRQA